MGRSQKWRVTEIGWSTFYDEVTPSEMYAIISKNLGDLETFAAAAVAAIDHPETFDLTVED